MTMKSEEDTRPSTPDTTTRISVTVPASDVEQDIQILLTPKKSTRYAEPPTLQGSSVAAMVPPLELQKSRNPEQPESFAVPLEYLQRWPPSLPRGPGSFGWTWRNWYVVKKGRHPGIYMDFWGNVHTLVNVAGGRARRANSYNEAMDIWRNAERRNEIIEY